VGTGYSLVLAPAAAINESLPYDVEAGAVRLAVAGERSAAGAFWGPGTRRFKAYWTSGPWRGAGFVEIRPASARSAQIVVQLERPRRPLAHVWWDHERLGRAARELVRTMRNHIEGSDAVEHALAAESS
jgi:hypothetical protein